jgi:hypothetical protein
MQENGGDDFAGLSRALERLFDASGNVDDVFAGLSKTLGLFDPGTIGNLTDRTNNVPEDPKDMVNDETSEGKAKGEDDASRENTVPDSAINLVNNRHNPLPEGKVAPEATMKRSRRKMSTPRLPN